ncbi:unnamed protein product [Callosobruchus maculatus]|uniref:Lipocalin/cytosolic fatty-acid binding domain-containing protein n=1 Tax=Callosobruchus maculatus TaxID=64391 RepID=A0A653CSW4_CALMS|nr:unnamed protein product [Callosobruchus maculatus]
MILTALVVLYLAYGVSTHKDQRCVKPLETIQIDRNMFSGTWFIQDTYSESGIPPGPCMTLHLTVSPDNKFQGVHSWKEKQTTRSMITPEIDAPPTADPYDTKIIYVRIHNDTLRGWFLGVDYDKYGIFYGCTGINTPFVYLWTREETRNEDVMEKITAYASRRVILPKRRMIIDHSTCQP